MRILHLTSHLNVGGVTSYVLSLSKALVARGHRVVIASGGGQLEPQVQAVGAVYWRVPLHTKAEFSPQVFSAIRELSRRLTQEPVDVLHAHTRVGQVAAARLSRRHRIPYVTTWHGFFRFNLGRWLWPCTGDTAIAISEPVRQHLVHAFRVPAERVSLIPHGIDPQPFESPLDPAAQEALRRAVGLPAGSQVVGTIARLVPSKGVHELLYSFVEVRSMMPETHLLIVGDGPERERLAQLARALGVAGAVHFAGTLPETRVALSLMSVFVFLPAEQEGFGLSLLEAMASGRPLVAVRRGGGASWVLDQDDAVRTVEPGDVTGLAEAIIHWLRNGEAACRAAGTARALVKERYTLARVVEQVEGVYQRLVDRRSSIIARGS